MKERLMKLLYETMCEQYDKRCQITAQDIADYLLANGVIVLPCAVGDKVYWINRLTKEIEHLALLEADLYGTPKERR